MPTAKKFDFRKVGNKWVVVVVLLKLSLHSCRAGNGPIFFSSLYIAPKQTTHASWWLADMTKVPALHLKDFSACRRQRLTSEVMSRSHLFQVMHHFRQVEIEVFFPVLVSKILTFTRFLCHIHFYFKCKILHGGGCSISTTPSESRLTHSPKFRCCWPSRQPIIFTNEYEGPDIECSMLVLHPPHHKTEDIWKSWLHYFETPCVATSWCRRWSHGSRA